MEEVDGTSVTKGAGGLEGSAMVSNLGAIIRRERQKRGMTLVQLCDVAMISPAFLSLVERGKSTPSLGTMAGIAKALGLSVSSFLQIGLPPEAVTRKGHRAAFAVSDSRVRYERMSTVFTGQNLDAVLMHIPPGYKSKTVTNIGEEWIYILEGELHQTIDDSTVILNEGDTCHFRGDSPHSYVNKRKTPAKVIWVGTVSIFGDLQPADRRRV
ncbi:helix-turn-helix domain-containing protein [Chelatococcus asaccharovorans]|uniref:XRE family transcriptional regulator n=1 Tax=Chelatococcus asaccharovorans TaxID=28210 RepID=A0A2V3U4M8_9HYPH|nr:XRE family transcriptional regulator [Chelatococcus asaccharovorans]MBS7703732.1 helix-turn-helix transcriptional regulator [Chelatococcus asaccharovorans]PXW57890.1 XRE family transcriptional regulator [Chelatococcus asaccharovorans]